MEYPADPTKILQAQLSSLRFDEKLRLAILRSFGVGFSLGHHSFFPKRFMKISVQIFEFAKSLPVIPRSLIIGATSCLLPCGWLYTFGFLAISTANPITGGLVLFAFWLGTVPAMFFFVVGMDRVFDRFKKRIPLAMASLVVGLGCYMMYFRAPVQLEEMSFAKQPAEIEYVDQANEIELPCCEPLHRFEGDQK